METTQNSQLFGKGVCDKLWLRSIRPTQPPAAAHFGLEMELFPFDAKTLLPLGLQPDGFSSPDVLNIIHANCPDSKLKLDEHSGLSIGVVLNTGGNFSLEPGGQIEYSSKPADSYDELIGDIKLGLGILEKATFPRVVFLGTGTNPMSKADHPLVVPKERYEVMTRYFSAVPGGRGVHMMRHTATVQPNIDIPGGAEDWADAVNLTLCITPFAKHLFANSPWFQGKASAFPSERQEIWPFVDASRTGVPLSIPFSEDVACAYAKWAKSASVFMVNGLPLKDQPLPGELSFTQWLEHGFKGTEPGLTDWEFHLGTLFPDLRLRGFLEVRSVDAQPFEHMFAPMAFFGAAISTPRGRQKFWQMLEALARDHEILRPGSQSHLSKSESFLQLLGRDRNDKIFQDSAIQNHLLETAIEILGLQNESSAVASLLAFQNYKLKPQRKTEFTEATDFVRYFAVNQPLKQFSRYLSASGDVEKKEGATPELN